MEKLVNRYQECRSLFCNKLLLRNATIDHVIDGLELLFPKADLIVRKELLLVLNGYIAQGATIAMPQGLVTRSQAHANRKP